MPAWIELEPECEDDGTRYAWRLVVYFDPDWQDYRLGNESTVAHVFSLHIADDMVDDIRNIEAREA